MKGTFKTIFYGLLLWAIPFIVAIAVWDTETNAPKIGTNWFAGLIGLTWAIAYAIVICTYSKGVKWDVREGWRVGLIWYLKVVVLELVFIVGLFGTPLGEVYHLFLTNSPSLIVTIGLGYAGSNMRK